jgi:GT2 family glycosyltransferase
MHLHSVIISFNRLELLQQCYHSYKETVSVPYSLMIIDNASDNETRRWLSREVSPQDHVIFLEHNRFPGYACNRGWEQMPPQTTHLHRSDNDFAYLHGWCEAWLRSFKSKSKIGQVGLRTDHEEQFHPNNVGGNNVILRELWERGLRYDERPWGK